MPWKDDNIFLAPLLLGVQKANAILLPLRTSWDGAKVERMLQDPIELEASFPLVAVAIECPQKTKWARKTLGAGFTFCCRSRVHPWSSRATFRPCRKLGL